MEQFIKDTKLEPDDINLDYDMVDNLYQNGELAMYLEVLLELRNIKIRE